MCWVAAYQGLSRRGQTEAARRALIAAAEAAGGAIGRWGDAFFSSMSAFAEARANPRASAAWAERATRLAAALDNPLLSADVFSNLGRHHGLCGDTSRGLALCQQAVELSDALGIRRGRVNARNAMAQVAVMGDHPDVAAIVRETVEVSAAERLWFDLWPSLRALARWWADHGRGEDAAVVVGYLVAQGLSSGERASALLASDPRAAAWLAHGAALDREALVAFVLEHLGALDVDSGPPADAVGAGAGMPPPGAPVGARG
jgi:hypothetical protein